MSEARRIVITHIHEKDAFYRIKDRFIGLAGEFKLEPYYASLKGYFAGDFVPDEGVDESIGGGRAIIFFAIRYRRI